jgi:hypothetical protein
MFLALSLPSAYICFTLLFFGNRGGMRRGQQVPIEKYIPSLSPLLQHSLQLIFLSALVLAVFPQLFSKLASSCAGSCNRTHWLDALNAAIKRLRDALSESADAPVFIETLA